MIADAQAATTDHTATTGHAADAAAHHPGGLVGDPAFWVGLAFLIVAAFIYLKARKPILAALDGRAATIKARIDEARQLREDAQKMLADYQRRQRDAMKEAEDIVRHAKEEAERLRVKAEADLEASIKRREQQAMERIAQAEAQALTAVRNQAVDVATAAASRLLADTLKETDQARLADDAIRGLPSALH